MVTKLITFIPLFNGDGPSPPAWIPRVGDANVVEAEIINKKSDIYELKLGEMIINIESVRDLNGSVSVALRPEKINITKETTKIPKNM